MKLNKHADSILNGIDVLIGHEQRRQRYHDLQLQKARLEAQLAANDYSPVTAGLIRTDLRDVEQEINQLLETNINETTK